jgi:methionine-S-sulfoxide reductase
MMRSWRGDETMYTKKIYFSGGDFHELQEVFQHVPGVMAATTGYLNAAGPTGYEAVKNGEDPAVMGVEVGYDPQKVDLSILLDIFFAVVDPYAKAGQGQAQGAMFRSGVWYEEAEDEPQIEYHMNFIISRGRRPAVTGADITVNDFTDRHGLSRKCYTVAQRLKNFQPAAASHQHYFQRHPEASHYIDFARLRELKIIQG